MKYKYNIFQTTDKNNWNNNLLKVDYSTFFQTYENLISDSNGVIPVFITVENDYGEIKGQLGLRIIKTTVMYSSKILRQLRPIISKISSRIIWIYGPIIYSDNKNERIEILQQIIKAVDDIAKKFDTVQIEGQTPPCDFSIDEDYLNTFLENGYIRHDNISFIDELNVDKNELWHRISKKTRGDITRAKRRNINSKLLERKDELEDFIRLNQEWCKTKGLIITDTKKEKELLWNNLQNGIEKIFLAYQNNELISAIRVGFFNRTAYTNFVINSYSDSTNLGGTLLTWIALEWAKDNNLKFYDFSGGPILDKPSDQISSLLFYKRKWGGKEIPYYVLIKVRKKTSYKLFLLFFKLLRKYHNLRAS
ncbi:hypothetical protein C6988_00880 [Nitrosopumilus sp. b1]|uniref:hypothetical protein n=1 Tax=Nitrosopumilus sp. b1 TaxID=2109907 RepID=UPI0015F641D6|nr:hypothetical protein [Nitrosopumilus sp. b1]KAF6243995.1 hypothetical protein C6988_00880 [Nitrosopumilus sp. b1]